MEHRMMLTEEQEAILSGSKGETMARVMETLVRYGDLFGADKMVPVEPELTELSLVIVLPCVHEFVEYKLLQQPGGDIFVERARVYGEGL